MHGPFGLDTKVRAILIFTSIVEHDYETLLESHSSFGDKLTLIPSNLSPKRDCGSTLTSTAY